MIEVVIFGEGQTEETFVRDVLAPAMWNRNVSLQPRLIRTSSMGRGGALTRERVVRALAYTLRERRDTYVTTLFDLYGLDALFPGVQECTHIADPINRVLNIEAKFGEVIVQAAACRPDRFLPYIQPYEFESLLFSDIVRAIEIEPEWRAMAIELVQVRSTFQTPEHINDGPTTHPSARFGSFVNPSYRKVLHGPRLAERIGLDSIRRECRHFSEWIERLEGLAPL